MFSPEPADTSIVKATEDLVQLELMLNRFNKLMGELIRGTIARNSFRPWEVDLLLDLEACKLVPRRRLEILRQYQRAVERQLQGGQGPPMKLSEFLEMRDRRRAAQNSAPLSPGKQRVPPSGLP